jgi:N-acetylgalactosamine kinase
VCERYCGTQSGGMDQAISIMGQRGLAKVVHFNPVRTDDVALPGGGVFVIANSLTVSNKAETAHTRYNLRVVECRLAACVLALALGAAPDAARATRTLREVEPLLPAGTAAGDAVAAHLHEGAYTSSELEELLGVSLAFLFADNSASLAVLLHASRAGFKLRDRAAHVYAEAARVGAFAAACASHAPLDALGALMDASHASCRDLYECSCAELEELVATAKARGALGARLTGAGWGGCAVMLVREDGVAAFLDDLRRLYFDKRVASGLLPAEELPSALFATKPGAGAAVLKLKLPPTPRPQV